MTTQAPRHKVFISFHSDDEKCKDRFVAMMGGDFVDKSVHDDNIDDTNLKAARIRQIIRDDYIADATVTVVLIGPCTWQRKHVDWEIGSSLRKTRKNPRCGLLGILLPNHPDFGKGQYHFRLVPPRLADNCQGDDSFAKVYNWLENPDEVRRWIHTAFQRRDGTPPNNRRLPYGNNRTVPCEQGWQ